MLLVGDSKAKHRRSTWGGDAIVNTGLRPDCTATACQVNQLTDRPGPAQTSSSPLDAGGRSKGGVHCEHCESYSSLLSATAFSGVRVTKEPSPVQSSPAVHSVAKLVPFPVPRPTPAQRATRAGVVLGDSDKQRTSSYKAEPTRRCLISPTSWRRGWRVANHIMCRRPTPPVLCFQRNMTSRGLVDRVYSTTPMWFTPAGHVVRPRMLQLFKSAAYDDDDVERRSCIGRDHSAFGGGCRICQAPPIWCPKVEGGSP
ncbi:hypothetical protein EDB83DRAFT_2318181 [Lactarius deliciosus]|nr:hypothetical protein EDB83DRAFT_2318181 [Lactarius deliciosus]